MLRLFAICILLIASTQAVADETKPVVGKKAADQYFLKRNQENSLAGGTDSADVSVNRRPASSGNPRYLALHVGSYIDDDAYNWGGRKNDEDLGKLTIGVTYRVGEWVNSMDLLFRADFNSFSLKEGSPVKLSLLPMVTFPDANSQFPLYFGGGIGLGVYLKNIDDESALSLDYQLVLGARFLEVIDTVGFFMEAGLKNHIHLLSDGQYNGVFVAVGGAFTF